MHPSDLLSTNVKAQYQHSKPISLLLSEINHVSKHLNSDRISNEKLDVI